LPIVLSDPATAPANLRLLASGIQRQHDSAKVLRALELAAALPSLNNNLTLQNDLDYQRLLLGQSVDLARLESRVEANPNEFSFRVTEALALLKIGKKSQALQVMENIETDIDAAKLPPSQLAILASAIAATGDLKKASAALALCPKNSLTVQEGALIQEAFSSVAAPVSKSVAQPTAAQPTVTGPGSMGTKAMGASAMGASATATPSPSKPQPRK
jgi:hypothetical protein